MRRIHSPPILLLVEDDSNDQLLFRRALVCCGFPLDLVAVEDAESAIDHLSRPRVRPSAVLTDLTLPGKSGLEFLDWIRQRSSWTDLPVMMWSSSLDERAPQEAYARGANGYLVKPQDPARFAEIVRAVMAALPCARIESC